jgi:phosphohistidine phosphatase SixA
MRTRTPRGLACAMTMLLAGLTAPAWPDDPARASEPAPAKFVEIPASKDILAQLRQGGWVLYMRHGTTDNTRPDRVPSVDLNDCTTQRPLNNEGQQLATRVGEAIRTAGIPIGEIRSSPLCRAKDTATLAFPNAQITEDMALMYTANLTTAQKEPILANTRRLLTAPVARGSNRLLVAHAPNLMDLIGYFPKEGTLVAFRPDATAGINYVASIPPALWPALIGAGAAQ